jgi:hypothetical protein
VTLANPLTDRLVRLTQAFQQLKERIRDAVALEMGKVIADAVRGWITSALQTRREPLRYEPEYPSRYDDGWDDSHEDWNTPEPEFVPQTVEPTTKPTRWAAALSIGMVTARWLIARRIPFAASLGVGVLAGACALAGGPLVQSALSTASAAADLARIARPEP